MIETITSVQAHFQRGPMGCLASKRYVDVAPVAEAKAAITIIMIMILIMIMVMIIIIIIIIIIIKVILVIRFYYVTIIL